MKRTHQRQWGKQFWVVTRVDGGCIGAEFAQWLSLNSNGNTHRFRDEPRPQNEWLLCGLEDHYDAMRAHVAELSEALGYRIIVGAIYTWAQSTKYKLI